MKKITNIIATFQYRINGWVLDITYEDGTTKEFQHNSDKNNICDALSFISSDWHEYDDEIEDVDFDGFDEEQLLLEPDDIETAIFHHFKLTDPDFDVEFRISEDS